MIFKNLTRSNLQIERDNSDPIILNKPDKSPYVLFKNKEVNQIEGVCVFEQNPEMIELPKPEANVILIVTENVKRAFPNRKDVMFPADSIFVGDGLVVCRGLVSNF
jgi:hypothetical protein